MSHYDSFIIGQVCMDVNTDYGREPVREPGGAVLYSGFAAAAMGKRVAVLHKGDPQVVDAPAVFARQPAIKVYALPSTHATMIRNVYLTPDRERRDSHVDSVIDPYLPGEVPPVDASVYQLAGLMRGDISHSMIELAAARSMAALDVQCILRVVKDGRMVFEDWPEKKDYLKLIHFLKTDAYEAEILTGLSDMEQAARVMAGWGAKEVMVTHNSRVIICDGSRIYEEPLKPRSLQGRTGRGDTCFSCYITERLTKGIPEALRMAAALVSLKMETPGPYMGSREEAEEYASRFWG